MCHLVSQSDQARRPWPAWVLLAVLLVTACCASPALAQGASGVDAMSAGVVRTTNPDSTVEAALFYVVAAGIVFCSLGVCLCRNVVRMALFLFCALAAVALLYFLLAASFVGAIQLIVYAGGTLILLVFGVMLTSKSPWIRFEIHWAELTMVGLVCLVLFGAMVQVFLGSQHGWVTVASASDGTSVETLGRSLVTTYLVPFEVAGVLLMIVMVGAAHLARQEEEGA